MLFWVTAQIRMNGLVPELFNAIPIGDLSTLEEEADIVALLFALSFLTDVEVEFGVAEVVFLANTSLLYAINHVRKPAKAMKVADRILTILTLGTDLAITEGIK